MMNEGPAWTDPSTYRRRLVKRSVLACMEKRPRRTEDGIDILPIGEMLRRLWAGELLASP